MDVEKRESQRDVQQSLMQLSLESVFTTELWRLFFIGLVYAFHGLYVEHELIFVMKIM